MDLLILRAYAVRALTARLTELDTERSRIVELLSQWGSASEASESAASVPTAAPRRRRVARPAGDLDAGPRQALSDPTPVAVEREEARILPRRRARAVVSAEPPAAVLPPMPRLVKARAS